MPGRRQVSRSCRAGRAQGADNGGCRALRTGGDALVPGPPVCPLAVLARQGVDVLGERSGAWFGVAGMQTGRSAAGAAQAGGPAAGGQFGGEGVEPLDGVRAGQPRATRVRCWSVPGLARSRGGSSGQCGLPVRAASWCAGWLSPGSGRPGLHGLRQLPGAGNGCRARDAAVAGWPRPDRRCGRPTAVRRRIPSLFRRSRRSLREAIARPGVP